ncbi:uncharacterized protein LOC142332151 [Lycorma delicatula]|uniref:uncharacterized protein LOC142332151 n=1 Tax=Lycorma delicatula TaxID=130591 RepID=UPI003F515B0F
MAAVTMNFSMEEFIEEVRIRPAIYDITTPEYSDRSFKKVLWTEICQKFTVNWNQLSEDDRDTIGKEMKNRWKSIRDAFVREVRYMKEAELNGEPQVKKKKYIYYDQLCFLLPTVGARSMRSHNVINDEILIKEEYNNTITSNNYDDSIKAEGSHNDNDFDSIRKMKKNKRYAKRKIGELYNGDITIYKDNKYWNNTSNNECEISVGVNSSSSNNNINNNNNNNNSSSINNSNNNSHNNSANSEEFEGERVQVTPSIEDIIPDHHILQAQPDLLNPVDDSGYRPDPDYMFLMSLLPSFKKLGEEKKSMVKIEISSLLHQAIYGNKVVN